MFFIGLLMGLSQNLPDGPGKETVQKLCQDCHDLDTVIMENRTKEGWKQTVDKMGERGAEGTDAQFEAVIAYLTSHFGRTNVNRASAEEIAALGFSPKDAAAIVQYREKNGPFKDWRDLKKAADPAQVEAAKNHIAVK